MTRLEELAQHVADTMDQVVRKTCPTCKRGAAGQRIPDFDDLEAMVTIRDSFNGVRRNFSPEMEDKFRKFDSTISYLHALIAGSIDG